MLFRQGRATVQDLTSLRTALERISPLADVEWHDLARLVQPQAVDEGGHLLRAGAIASRAFFLRRGLLREYYMDSAGAEATRRFCDAGEISGSLADLLSGRPSLCSIEALERSEVWAVDWRQCDALSRRASGVMLLLRRLAEGLYLRKTEREFEMLTLPAAERYGRFVHSFPALARRVPDRLIASYLGITPVHLSRIRGRERSTRGAAARSGKRQSAQAPGRR